MTKVIHDTERKLQNNESKIDSTFVSHEIFSISCFLLLTAGFLLFAI